MCRYGRRAFLSTLMHNPEPQAEREQQSEHEPLELRFESLEINQPRLDVTRTPDGMLYVAGVRIDPNKKDEGGGGADWLLRQREIVIRDGRLSWTDQLRGAPALALSNVTMVLQNRWTAHRFALKATPPGTLSDPLDVR